MKRVYYYDGIHYEYKGCEIKRVENTYFGKKEISYYFDKQYFVRLKDVKHYIDVVLTTQDTSEVDGKKEQITALKAARDRGVFV